MTKPLGSILSHLIYLSIETTPKPLLVHSFCYSIVSSRHSTRPNSRFLYIRLLFYTPVQWSYCDNITDLKKRYVIFLTEIFLPTKTFNVSLRSHHFTTYVISSSKPPLVCRQNSKHLHYIRHHSSYPPTVRFSYPSFVHFSPSHTGYTPFYFYWSSDIFVQMHFFGF